jgi:two-component system, NtrC family, nitrogen regulation response regulator GlnG
MTKYFKEENYSIKISKDINELKTFLKDIKFDIIIVDISYINKSLSSFISDLNILKRKIGIIILFSNEFFNFDFNKFKYLQIDFIKKPFTFSAIKKSIFKLTSRDQSQNNNNFDISIPDLDKTDKTKYMFNAIIKVIKNDLNLLISGESGTGKKKIAETINNLTSKKRLLEITYADYRNNYFSKVLTNEISTADFLRYKKVINAELSNYILLSNIDAMNYGTQKLLYEVLKSKKQNLIPLFQNKKIIATTSKNIKNSLRNNNFSNELYYQLDMYNIFTIPLRDRAEDIPALTRNIITKYNKKNNTFIEIDDNSFYSIMKYLWPGNTKQLKNFINRCLKVSEKDIISKTLIDNELDNEFSYEENGYLDNWKINFRDLVSKNIRGYLNNNKKINSGVYYKILKEFEKPMLIEVLKFANNNQLLSAEILGINRNTLRKKMSDYEIQVIKKTTD